MENTIKEIKCEVCGVIYELKKGAPIKCWICGSPYFIEEKNGEE